MPMSVMHAWRDSEGLIRENAIQRMLPQRRLRVNGRKRRGLPPKAEKTPLATAAL